MPTNDERAERARVILEAYGMYVGDPDDPKANLTDVLVDLMHLDPPLILWTPLRHNAEKEVSDEQSATCIQYGIQTGGR